jgi:hypothetical protein
MRRELFFIFNCSDGATKIVGGIDTLPGLALVAVIGSQHPALPVASNSFSRQSFDHGTNQSSTELNRWFEQDPLSTQTNPWPTPHVST